MKLKKSLRKAKKSLGCIFGGHKGNKKDRQSSDGSNIEQNRNDDEERILEGERSLSPRLSCIVRDEELVAYIEDEPSKAPSLKASDIKRSTRPTTIAFDRARSMKDLARRTVTVVAPPDESLPNIQEDKKPPEAPILPLPPPILGTTTSEYSYVSSVTESLVSFKVKPSTEEKLRHIRTASLDKLNSSAIFQEGEPIQFGSYNKLLSPASDALTDDDPDPLPLETAQNGITSTLGGLTLGLQSPLSNLSSTHSKQSQSPAKTKRDEDAENVRIQEVFPPETEVIPDENNEIEVHVIDAPSDERSSSKSPNKRQNESSFFSSWPKLGRSTSSRIDPKSPLREKDTNIDNTNNGEKRDAPYPDDSLILDIKKPKVEETPELFPEKFRTIRYDGWSKYDDKNVSFGNDAHIGWAKVGDQVVSFGNSTQVMGTNGKDPTTKPRVLSPPLMESLQMFLPHSCSEDHFWLKYSLVRDGASLETALDQIKGSTRTIIAIETNDGEVFGSFTSTPWKIQPDFFGNGEAFLWRLKRSRFIHIPVNSSCDDQSMFASKLDRDIEVYPYSQQNTYVQKCTNECLIVGGGPWHEDEDDCPFDDEPKGVGLRIYSDLEHGSTGTCATFTNRALSKTSPLKFSITNMEIWTLTPFYPETQAKAAEARKIFLSQAQSPRRTQ